MRNSIIMTVYERNELVLLNTFMALAKNDLKDTEIIVVNDGSKTPYDHVRACADGTLPLKWIEVDTVRDRPDTYNIDGYNNPAYAMNCGFDAAKGENIALMSSDVMVPPHMMECALKRDLVNTAVTPRVIDQDSAMVYCGVERIFPAPWFLITARENWYTEKLPVDEGFLRGIAFEDNDVAARVALRTGKVAIDQDIVAWHQSHKQIAYSDDLEGWQKNHDYCQEKWGDSCSKEKWSGVPWSDPKILKTEAVQVAGTILVNVERGGAK